MTARKSLLRRLGPIAGLALILASCSSSSEADGTSSTSLGDAGDGTGADDDDATSGADDDGTTGPSGLGDDDDGPDIVVPGVIDGDDDTAAPGSELDAGVAADLDASVAPTPVDVPGDGFVTVGTTDAGTFEILCGSATCACADGEDNDGDGLSDGFDSECTGPFDNDEGTFATGIPGDNRDPKWQDCFFDGNSGAGDDGCRYHTDCLTGDAEPDAAECSLTQACIDFCAPLTPPGCDCFGCCEVPYQEGTVHIMLSEQCSLATLDDEGTCPRCVPTDTCGNECGECEICIGETLEDLPDSCWDNPPDGMGGSPGTGGSSGGGGTPGGGGTSASGGTGNTGGDGAGGAGDPPDSPPPNVCDGGAQACSLSEDCGIGQYCQLGCCIDRPAR